MQRGRGCGPEVPSSEGLPAGALEALRESLSLPERLSECLFDGLDDVSTVIKALLELRGER